MNESPIHFHVVFTPDDEDAVWTIKTSDHRTTFTVSRARHFQIMEYLDAVTGSMCVAQSKAQGREPERVHLQAAMLGRANELLAQFGTACHLAVESFHADAIPSRSGGHVSQEAIDAVRSALYEATGGAYGGEPRAEDN